MKNMKKCQHKKNREKKNFAILTIKTWKVHIEISFVVCWITCMNLVNEICKLCLCTCLYVFVIKLTKLHKSLCTYMDFCLNKRCLCEALNRITIFYLLHLKAFSYTMEKIFNKKIPGKYMKSIFKAVFPFEIINL